MLQYGDGVDRDMERAQPVQIRLFIGIVATEQLDYFNHYLPKREIIGNNLYSRDRAASLFEPFLPSFELVCQGHSTSEEVCQGHLFSVSHLVSHMGTPREVVLGHAR